MEVGQWFTDFISIIWQFYSIELPFLGMTTGQLFIGMFVLLVTVYVFKTLFRDGDR